MDEAHLIAVLLVASWKAWNDGLCDWDSDRSGAALGNGGGSSASAASRQHIAAPSSRRVAASSANSSEYFRSLLQDFICCLHVLA